MPIQLSGSLVITGSITTTGVIIMSGSIASASYSSTSDLLQGTGSVGFTTTASFNAVSSSQQQISSSYIALSASYNTFSGSASTRITANSSSIQQISSSQQQISASLLNVISIFATTGSNSFRANQSITGSLVVSSTITAQTLVVQTVTSSIVYSSGSNIFGCDLNSRQTFTGSVNITGSTTLNGALTGTSATFNGDIAYNNVGNQNLIITSGAANNGRMYIYSAGNADIGFQASGSSWFLNKLGIGTNAPSDLLHIEKCQAGGIGMIIRNSCGATSNTSMCSLISLQLVGTGQTGQIGVNLIAGKEGDYSSAGVRNAFFAIQTACSDSLYERMRITSGGNVGIGVTPTTLDAGGVNLQIKDRSALFQLAAVNSTYLSNNIYYDGSWKRIVSGYGTLIRLTDDNNGFSFLTTGTGGANSAVTFTSALTITNAGASTFSSTITGTTIYGSTAVCAGSLIVNQASTAADIILKFQINGTNKWLVGLTNDVADDNFTIYQDGVGGGNRFTISTSGNVGIGTNSPADLGATNTTLTINGYGGNAGILNLQYAGTNGMFIYSDTSGTTQFESRNLYMRFGTNNTERMRITCAGITCFGFTVCAPCFATISDYRMKSNVRPIAGLSIIMNTKPYKFEYNYDCSTSFGMIAHELQDTLPEAVFGQKDGEVMQGVDYMKLLPITIKAIQEQQCTICSQASRITLLESRLGIS